LDTRAQAAAAERCAACNAALAQDQRYCLNCGLRRGAPRLDFTAFWRRYGSSAGALSPLTPGDRGSRRHPAERLPSWRLSCALAAGVLAIGIAAGAAIGPSAGGSANAALAAIVPNLLAQVRASAAAAGSVGGASSASSSASSSAPEALAPASAEPVHRRRRKHRRRAAPAAETTPVSSGEGTSAPSAGNEGSKHSSPSGEHKPAPKPPIDHVWVVTLSQGSFAQALEKPSSYPYLDTELVPEGTLLTNYKLVGASELANDVALLSGQAPNSATEGDCTTYTAVPAETFSSKTGLAAGPGCVYPPSVQTLAGEASTAGLKWRAYAQGMSPSGSVPLRTCMHPALGEAVSTAAPVTGADYVLARNPFVYFDSLLEPGVCTSDVVDFSQFATELQAPTGAPNLNWIIPGACEDGASDPCAPGGPSGGVAPADSFLKSVVEQITAVPEYHSHGLIVITFDSASAPTGSAAAATESVVGALLLSPFVHHGAQVTSALNDFSLLKSIERLFGVPALGHASDPGLAELGATVYQSSPSS
jgi:hypothetical protein